MNTLVKDCLQRILVASAASLTLAAHLMAQQEVSPERFESAVQSVAGAAGARQDPSGKAAQKRAKQTAEVQHAGGAPRQTS